MHLARKRGDAIGALAIVIIDNPMCPGTGHRICNDCMKACIYQKQEPVNIPQAETGVLTDVLEMPYGVEMYGLLTRWNPLNIQRPYALPYNGRNVLVVGLGPAGYTLAHYLLNEGFGVVAIDGLKIEPLADDISGAHGHAPRPVRSWSEIYSPLDERVLEGFGGVSEYGITVRWDKNFLTLIHLTLARRQKLKIYGGVRFGGSLPIEEAWERGIDHVAIAAGAGRPTIIDIKNNLIRGIRKASDFLMALQLTGAFKSDALSNLQVRLPAVVIGGGLTGVDTATELMAYYPIQVEKTLDPLRGAVEGAGRGARARDDGRRRAGHPRRVPGARPRGARRTRAGQGGGRGAGLHHPDPRLGRRHAGLSQAPAGCAGLSPQSRGSDQGVRGRHCLRREHVARGSHSGRLRPRHGDGLHAPDARGRGPHRTARPHRAGGRRHRAQHHLREGAPGHVQARWPAALLPGLPRGEAGGRQLRAGAGRRTASSPRTTPTASSSPTTATTTRATTATSSRRCRRPSTATRTWSRCSRTRSRRSIRRRSRPARPRGISWSRASTTSCWRAWSAWSASRRPSSRSSSGRPRRRGTSIPGSSIACRTSSGGARTCTWTITSRRC